MNNKKLGIQFLIFLIAASAIAAVGADELVGFFSNSKEGTTLVNSIGGGKIIYTLQAGERLILPEPTPSQEIGGFSWEKAYVVKATGEVDFSRQGLLKMTTEDERTRTPVKFSEIKNLSQILVECRANLKTDCHLIYDDVRKGYFYNDGFQSDKHQQPILQNSKGSAFLCLSGLKQEALSADCQQSLGYPIRDKKKLMPHRTSS